MSAGSPQCRVRQRTEEDITAVKARIMNRAVIPERIVIRVDLMVAPLDDIHEIIQTYTRATSTTMPVLYSLDWSKNFM